MLVTKVTREELKQRRLAREMTAKGYERISGPWDVIRGTRWRHKIVDTVIDANGRNVWVKCEE